MATNDLPTKRLTVGMWLRNRLKADKFRQIHLAAALGVDPTQISHWLDGEERIPPHYYADIRKELYLDDEAFKKFIELTSTDEKARDFSRIIEHLAKEPLNAEYVAERLEEYCALLARSDEELYGTYEAALHAHVSAAHRVLRSIERAAKRDDGQLITPTDIYLHLTYPMLYYFSFFVERLRPTDGPGAITLRSSILEFFRERAEDRRTGREAEDILRAHAIHMACRFDPHFDHGRLIAKPGADPQERRMALFGHAFRQADDEVTDRLVHVLEKDPAIRECAFAFDSLHYGDVKVKTELAAKVVGAANVMTKFAITILNDPRAPFRRLARARLRLLLEHGGVRPAENPQLAGYLRKLQQHSADENDQQSRALADQVKKAVPSSSSMN